MPTKIVFALSLSLFVALGCTSNHKTHPVASVPEKALETMGSSKAAEYTRVDFRKGQIMIGPLGQEYLSELKQMVEKNPRQVSEIKVLAWGDKKYSSKYSASNAEIKLANDRAASVKKYLQQNLNLTEKIDSYNMSQKPGPWSRLVRNDEFKTKEAFDTRIPSSVSEHKVSKAIVIIEYKK